MTHNSVLSCNTGIFPFCIFAVIASIQLLLFTYEFFLLCPDETLLTGIFFSANPVILSVRTSHELVKLSPLKTASQPIFSKFRVISLKEIVSFKGMSVHLCVTIENKSKL